MGIALKLRTIGIKVTNKQITNWANRNYIPVKGALHVGAREYPLYNLGDVEDQYHLSRSRDQRTRG